MRLTLLACLASAALIAPIACSAEQAFELTGKGVQIYTCTKSADGYVWVLKGPNAQLLDAAGTEVGHHFAGPSWQGKDGSLLTGEPEYVAEGGPGAISWLVLRAKTHSGQGMFATVKAIVRTRTQGGLAPTTGCDAGHEAADSQVPYMASYSFFPG